MFLSASENRDSVHFIDMYDSNTGLTVSEKQSCFNFHRSLPSHNPDNVTISLL